MTSRQASWDGIFSSEGRVFDSPLDEVEDFAKQLKKFGLTRALDLGCGTGRHTVYLKKKRFNVCGLDNALAGLRLTREWLVNERLCAPLVMADVHQPFPFKNGSFDALLSTRVIHHGRRDRVIGAVCEIIRVVRKGGAVLLTVPGGAKRDTKLKWIEPRTYIPLGSREKGIPHYVFTQEELKQLFAEFENSDVNIMDNGLIVVRAKK